MRKRILISKVIIISLFLNIILLSSLKTDTDEISNIRNEQIFDNQGDNKKYPSSSKVIQLSDIYLLKNFNFTLWGEMQYDLLPRYISNQAYKVKEINNSLFVSSVNTINVRTNPSSSLYTNLSYIIFQNYNKTDLSLNRSYKWGEEIQFTSYSYIANNYLYEIIEFFSIGKDFYLIVNVNSESYLFPSRILLLKLETNNGFTVINSVPYYFLDNWETISAKYNKNTNSIYLIVRLKGTNITKLCQIKLYDLNSDPIPIFYESADFENYILKDFEFIDDELSIIILESEIFDNIDPHYKIITVNISNQFEFTNISILQKFWGYSDVLIDKTDENTNFYFLFNNYGTYQILKTNYEYQELWIFKSQYINNTIISLKKISNYNGNLIILGNVIPIFDESDIFINPNDVDKKITSFFDEINMKTGLFRNNIRFASVDVDEAFITNDMVIIEDRIYFVGETNFIPFESRYVDIKSLMHITTLSTDYLISDFFSDPFVGNSLIIVFVYIAIISLIMIIYVIYGKLIKNG